MKEKIKSGISALKQRTRFIQGVAAGLLITSAVSYAITFTVFSPNTTISASQMNSNFAAIKTRIDELEVGFAARLNSNFSLTACNGSFMDPQAADYEGIQGDLVDYNDGNYNSGTGIYSVTVSGIYRVFLEAPNTINDDGYNVALEISTDSGSTWSQKVMYSNNSIAIRLVSGTLIRAAAGCGTKYGGPPTYPAVDSTRYNFAVKKF